MTDQRYVPPRAPLDAEPPSPHVPIPVVEPIPIGGWLFLVAFGLIVTPIHVVQLLFESHWPIFRDGHWVQLTTEGGAAYHMLWGPLIIFEIVGNLLLAALAGLTLAMFFKKSRRTPKFAIALYIFGLAIVLIDDALGNLIPAIASAPDDGSTKELVRTILVAAIWIPYFLLSKRVKKTFTR